MFSFRVKRFACLCFCIFLLNGINASAQSLMHGVGLTPTLLFGKDEFSNKFHIFQTDITYFPRFTFVENENSSVDVGAPLGIGIGIANSDSYDPAFVFSYDLPAVVDYNIGFKSTQDNEHHFGGYAGAGFGYYHVSVSGSTYSNFKGSTYGPIIRAGIRIGSAREDWHNHGFAFGVYYKKGLEDAKLTTVGFNVLADL